MSVLMLGANPRPSLRAAQADQPVALRGLVAPSEPLDLVSSHRTEIALVGLITLVGLVVRLPSFGESLFGDELSAVFIVNRSFGEMMHLLNNHSTELNPPFSSCWPGSA